MGGVGGGETVDGWDVIHDRRKKLKIFQKRVYKKIHGLLFFLFMI